MLDTRSSKISNGVALLPFSNEWYIFVYSVEARPSHSAVMCCFFKFFFFLFFSHFLFGDFKGESVTGSTCLKFTLLFGTL
jgi:hypothetical protein